MNVAVLGTILVIISLIWMFFYIYVNNLGFIDAKEICKNYFEIFNGSITDKVFFLFCPLFLACGIAFLFPATTSAMELICTTVSILLGLLFASLGALASFRSPDVNDKNKSKVDIESRIKKYNIVFNETIYLILFLALLSVAELFSIFIGIIISSNGSINKFITAFSHPLKVLGSIVVYYLAFSILLNSLMVLKRIGKLIKKD